MDQALKARRLGSAAARRQRIEERHLERERALQARTRHRKQVMSDIIALEGSNYESESETSSNADPDSAAETASESDVQTPGDPLSPEVPVQLSPATYSTTIDTMSLNGLKQESELSLLRTQSRPKMQATLTTAADWNYDRFSIFVDPAEVEELAEHIAEAEESSSSDSSEEEPEEYSPLKIATPVSYTIPKAKPRVVFITGKQDRTKLVTIDTSTNEPIASRTHVSGQMIRESPHDGFKAGETKLFQISNSSHETIESASNSSHPSRSLSITSQNESIISRSISQASDNSHRSPKRKSSLPLLFGGNKNGQSRISSIKKLIRTSTLGPPMAQQPYTGVLQRQTSGSTLETHFESRTPSIDEMRAPVISQFKRPMTARVPSPLLPFTGSTTTFPANYPTPTSSEPGSRPSSKGSAEVQVKPVSRFRQRSGSIGQALKSIGSGPKKADASAPPLPTLHIPSAQQVLQETRYPTPPPLTPRDPRRNTNYSPFPLVDKRTSSVNVGLGLRY